MKKIASPFLLVILCALLGSLNSCVRCSQDQYAEYIPDRNVILLRDDGVVMSPITPEGPFPEANNVLTINLKAPLKHSIGKRLEMGRDFTVQFDYATDGYIEIHGDKVVINLKYSSKYWENHNGRFPIRGLDKDLL